MTSQLVSRRGRAVIPEAQKNGLRLLTPTESRILRLLADYKTNKEVAEELSISPRTVETHRANIRQKLDLRGSHALVKFAARYKSQL